jgi:excisionase family DNA binding protein
MGFSPNEVARAYRVSRETVMAWIRAGQLRAVNIATDARPSYRVDAAALTEFMDAREVKVNTPRPTSRKPAAASQPAEYF